MNEFWEVHKKMLVFLGVIAIAALVAWFVIGSSLYSTMVRSSRAAESNYREHARYFGSGTPIEDVDKELEKALAEAGSSLLGLKKSLKMNFPDYVKIPKEQKRTKMTYFDTMLFEKRESIARRAAFGRLTIPPNLGWPDFVDIPQEEHDRVVPEMLKKLSVCEKVLSLLISSGVGRSKVKEIQDIHIGDVYVAKVRPEYPDFVRHYPISITFVAKLNAITKFLDLIHYVDLSHRKRRTGQYFEVEYLHVTWNEENFSKELKVDVRLSGLEFIEGGSSVENATPIATSKPGRPLGY